MSQRPPDLAPEEEPYLKLLEGLKTLELTQNEAELVARIGRFVRSPRILGLIAGETKWYSRWEVREALVENAHTPARYREPLETSFAVLDLMRELDGTGLEDAEKNEIREDIRSLLRSLPPVDVEVVKSRARALAAAARLPPAPPPPPSLHDLAAEARAAEEAAAVAAVTAATEPQALLEALDDPRERVRETALASPALEEVVLVEAARCTTHPDLLLAIVTNARWSFRDAVRKAVLANPVAPPPVRILLGRTEGLLLAFARYFNEPLTPHDKAAAAKGILAEVQDLPVPEREYLKHKIGPGWTPFIREVMAFIEDDFRRIQPVPVTTGLKPEPPSEPTVPMPVSELVRPEPAPPRSVRTERVEDARAAAPVSSPVPGSQAPLRPERPAEALQDDHFDDARHKQAPLDRHHVNAETRGSIGRLPVEERIRTAASSALRDELAFLLHDPDDRVFAALLSNPAMGDEERVAAARTASAERIRRLVENREVYALTGVKRALLHNPHTPPAVQLECLHHIGSPRELLLVMRDPKVRSLEVKAKARARLHERFRAMGTEERVAAIKQTGGELLNELWTEAFKDERTLVRLVSDRSLDEGVVLRIVRSRVAPREVLAAIGREPSFTNSYPVRLELAMNPKTPRDVVAKLVPKLSPPDRERLRASKQVADFVRDLS